LAAPGVLVYGPSTLRAIVVRLFGVIQRAERLSLGRALLVALALRVLWIALCPNEPTSDQHVYQVSALSIFRGEGYLDDSGNPANYWPVGYSALLAGAYHLLGPTPIAAFALNTLLGLLGVAAVYLLGRDLYGLEAGRIAALLAAVYPTFVFYTTCFASENAYVPGMAWVVWLGVRMARSERPWGYAALAGLVLGATCYVRATVLVLLPLIALFTWRERKNLKDAIVRGAVIAVVMGAVLVPWSLRAQHYFGNATPFSMNGGHNLWMGNHEGADGGYSPVPPDVLSMPVLERDRELGKRAKAFIKEHPLRYVGLCAARLVKTLASDTSGVTWNEVGLAKRLGTSWAKPLKLVNTLAHYALLAAGVVWLVSRRRSRTWSNADSLVVLSIALLAVPFVFIVSGNRYHLPLLPFLFVWAGAGARLLHANALRAAPVS
jgi:4-amino-4-deoxy-L-arabinose transferase-like glycosyltransferase